MKLGFIKSDFTNEQRVPLLPKDIKDFQNELYIETGFGESLNIPDQAYRDKNVTVLKTIRLIGSILCFVSISVFAYYAYRNMAMNFGIGRLSIYMRWPKWFWDFSVVLGFSLSSLYFIFQTILEAIDLFYVTKNKGVTFIEEIQEGENDNV